jgi:excisionase family DNA binding protein
MGIVSQNSKSDDTSQKHSRLAVTMREAAEMLSISERSVWTLVNRGELRSFKVGRSVRIPIDALRELAGGAS